MNTKFDVGDKVLIEAQVLKITIDDTETDYEVVFYPCGSPYYMTLKENELTSAKDILNENGFGVI